MYDVGILKLYTPEVAKKMEAINNEYGTAVFKSEAECLSRVYFINEQIEKVLL